MCLERVDHTSTLLTHSKRAATKANPILTIKMQIVFQIHGDLPDAGSRASVLCDAPLTLRKLQDLFPFEGVFHFRMKVSSRKYGFADCEYLWLDIVDDKVIDCEDNIVEIQALVVSIPDGGDEENYEEYIEEVSRYIPAERQPACEAHPPKKSTLNADEVIVSSSSGFFKPTASEGSSKPVSALKSIASTVKSTTQNINLNQHLNTVKSGASSIWNKVKATAAHLQQQAASASIDAATAKLANEMLALLAKDVNTTYLDTNAFHVQLMESLWAVQFPGQPFERISPTWKLAGWQKDDPVADLKNSGLLAIHSMIYLGDTYADVAQQMLLNNQANKKNNYPFAIVGVNLTLLLAELFRLRDPQ
jgi:hypothetical protein